MDVPFMHDLLGSGTRKPRAGHSETLDRKTHATCEGSIAISDPRGLVRFFCPRSGV